MKLFLLHNNYETKNASEDNVIFCKTRDCEGMYKKKCIDL